MVYGVTDVPRRTGFAGQYVSACESRAAAAALRRSALYQRYGYPERLGQENDGPGYELSGSEPAVRGDSGR